MSTETTEKNDPRVRLAAERTLLAWIRTGLAMMGFGFVVARFGWLVHEVTGTQPPATGTGNWSIWTGIVLILLGVAANLLAAWEYARVVRRFDRGEDYRPPALSAGIVVALVLAALGIAMLVPLAKLLW